MQLTSLFFVVVFGQNKLRLLVTNIIVFISVVFVFVVLF